MALNGYENESLDMILFDNIDDFLDFSNEDEEALGIVDPSTGYGDGDGSSSGSETNHASIPSLNGEGNRVTVPSVETNISDEINNISEDWITNFLDESNFDDSVFQSFSPVSVLDEPNNSSTGKGSSGSSFSSYSSSSSTSSNNEMGDTISMCPVGPTMIAVPARARTKRPRRPAPANIRAPIVPPVTDGPPAIPTLLQECEITGEESCPHPIKRRKKNSLAAEDGMTVQRCLHCGIQKTPQWRAGPMGPKTLCNACGVRYKSGRLFPEYRPAASPTFVPSLHSNSHKKVVEMRNKVCEQKAEKETPLCPAAKNCDLLAYIRKKE